MPSRPTPETADRSAEPLEAGEQRIHAALDLMIAEIREAAARTRAAEAAATVARRRQRQLELAAERVLDTLPGPERRPLITALQHARGDLQVHPRRYRIGGRAEALRLFLCETEGEPFHVSAATAWLTEQGHPAHPKEVANSLRDLMTAGFCTRMAHGRYRANWTHPLLVELRLAELSSHVS